MLTRGRHLGAGRGGDNLRGGYTSDLGNVLVEQVDGILEHRLLVALGKQGESEKWTHTTREINFQP